MIAGFLAACADAIWPPACPVCDGPLGAGEIVCGRCAVNARSAAGPRCVRCSAPLARPGLPCAGCATIPAGASARIIVAEYGAIRHLVIAWKYERRREVGTVLARWFAEALAAHPLARTADAVVPVPIHRRRARDRGFNQSDVLAAAAARALGIPLVTRVLVRTRHTTPQARLASRSDRAANVRDAFAILRPDAIRDRRVLLVDDVITTGATISACAVALRDAGACDVLAAAIAHPFHLADMPVDLATCDI